MVRRKPVNPFYVLLVIAGIVFFLTATAYGVMTVQGLHPERAAEHSEGGRHMLVWLDEHGAGLLMGELAVLAVFTFAAIGTDNFWSARIAPDTPSESVRTEENQ
jgi:hypothetical protein